jgi:hypothetical protein
MRMFDADLRKVERGFGITPLDVSALASGLAAATRPTCRTRSTWTHAPNVCPTVEHGSPLVGRRSLRSTQLT